MFDRSIVLIGMSGAGKSTVGRLLAQVLDMRFHDADEQLSKATGLSTPEIIAQKGEAYLRHNQALACTTLLQHSQGVIALGAGAILTPEVQRLLPMHTVIHLMSESKTEHTSAAPEQMLGPHQNECLPLYDRVAAHTVSTGSKPPMAIVRHIMEQLEITEEVS